MDQITERGAAASARERTSAEYVTELTADQAVSVAMASCDRAGWNDLVLKLMDVKAETSRRFRDQNGRR